MSEGSKSAIVSVQKGPDHCNGARRHVPTSGTEYNFPNDEAENDRLGESPGISKHCVRARLWKHRLISTRTSFTAGQTFNITCGC